MREAQGRKILTEGEIADQVLVLEEDCNSDVASHLLPTWPKTPEARVVAKLIGSAWSIQFQQDSSTVMRLAVQETCDALITSWSQWSMKQTIMALLFKTTTQIPNTFSTLLIITTTRPFPLQNYTTGVAMIWRPYSPGHMPRMMHLALPTARTNTN